MQRRPSNPKVSPTTLPEPALRFPALLPGWRSALALVGALLLAAPAGAQDKEDEPAPRISPTGRGLPRGIRLPNGTFPGDPQGAEEDGGGGEDAGSSSRARSTGPDSASSRGEDGAAANDEDEDRSGSALPTDGSRQKPPVLAANAKVTIDFVDTPLMDLVKYMAEITGRNFILTDDLKGNVTIISHKPVTVAEAYEAFLSALEQAGYTTVTTGQATKVVSTGEAGTRPIRTYEGGDIPYTDQFVTQIIQLENVSVTDMEKVVSQLKGKSASVITYAPTNTLIITDAASNIRRIYRIISQMDVAAPKSRLAYIQLVNAQASELKTIIAELYGVNSSSTSSSSSASATDRSSSRSRRSSRTREPEPEAASGSSTNVGSEGKYIEKVISDERTNSLIILANDEAQTAVAELVAELDRDVDPTSRAQIHVRYLEHAKAEDVAQVLSQLSSGGSSSSSSSARRSTSNASSRSGASSSRAGGTPGALGGQSTEGEGESSGAVAAFDEGLRVTSDENTNSLVIIATPDQYAIISQVIDKLDIRRKQVFVEAVILEMASDGTLDVGLGVHGGAAKDDGGLGIASMQLNGSSLGLSQDLLTGMAVGVFGQAIDVAFPDFTTGESTTLSIPAFGVVLNALQSNSSVNILSTPNILTLDNEEAKIIVGRNIPFPISAGRDNNNNPIISYQREDVAITLKVTPQINESNYVTLEVFQEVTDVEDDDSGLDPTTAGFITSKRSAETTVLVQDNQTVVLGGLIAATDTQVETKVPILGDLPLIGALFRGHRETSRKTNLLIFLTPHVIQEPADLEEVYRVKVAQRQEFIRRFYGKSRQEQEDELSGLLQYSMNQVDRPSPYRTKAAPTDNLTVIGGPSTTTTVVAPQPTSTPEPAIDPTDDPNYIEEGP